MRMVQRGKSAHWQAGVCGIGGSQCWEHKTGRAHGLRRQPNMDLWGKVRRKRWVRLRAGLWMEPEVCLICTWAGPKGRRNRRSSCRLCTWSPTARCTSCTWFRPGTGQTRLHPRSEGQHRGISREQLDTRSRPSMPRFTGTQLPSSACTLVAAAAATTASVPSLQVDCTSSGWPWTGVAGQGRQDSSLAWQTLAKQPSQSLLGQPAAHRF